MKSINVPNEIWNKLKKIKDEEKIMHFGDVIKLLITQRAEESIKHQPSIRSRILDLLSNYEPWNLSDLATEVSTANQDYDEVKGFVESILETVSEITKVGDAQYRLSEH